MSYLILPGDVLARLYDQPIALNRAHSGLSRIVAAWYARDGDRPFDMLVGRTGGKSGSFPMTRSVTHEMGFAHRTPFGGVEWTDLPEWARSNNPAYSLLAISLNTGSTSSSQVALTQQGSGWAGAQIYEGNGSSNVIRGGTTRDTTSAGSTGIVVPIGRRYCAVAVDQSTSIQCAVNGQLDTAGSPAGSYNATQSRLTSGDTTRPVWLMLCWRRALSQGEMVEYSARPDQLFKREPEVSYFLPAAASAGATDLVIAELAHGHPVDGSLGLTQAHALALAELLHAHPVDAPALTQVHVLAVDELAHAHPVDALTLTQTHVLAVDEATHAQPVDALTLTQTHVLSVAELTHGQPIDAAPLTQVHILTVAEATHAQLLDNLDLSGTASLSVAELTHGHPVDGDLALTQVHVLVVAEATHGHPVDGGLTLAGGSTLAVADLTHAQLADAIALGQVHVLAVAEALHGQLLDPLTLTQAHYLVLADGTHAQLVDALTLGTITAVTPGTRLLIVPRELRHLIIAAEQRHITVTH